MDVPGPGSYQVLDESLATNLRVRNVPNFSTAQERDTGAFALRNA